MLLFGEEFQGVINHQTNHILVEVPQHASLDNILTNIITSKYSTVFPAENVAQNFTSTVTYTVSAQNGDIREYDVVVNYFDLSSFNQSFSIDCNNEVNFRQWFGGDDRDLPEFDIGPRNEGAGQVIRLEQTLLVDRFAFLLEGGFSYSTSGETINENLTIRLDIRNQKGTILQTKDKTIFSNFSTLWVEFDLSELNMVLQANTKYNFTFYLVNGESLEVNTGIAGTNLSRSSTGDCYHGGISGRSKQSEGTSLSNWDAWHFKNSVHNEDSQINFNFKLSGKVR